jgi:predicted metal-dependent peptidase
MADEIRAFLESFVREPSFLEKYPYYAAVLAKMSPVADPSVKRMAVSLHGGRFFLHVNVDSFLEEPQYLRGVLLHEVHHVALGHLGHPRFASVVEPELLDLALEMSANEYIEEPLPDPITWQKYTALGIRAGQSSLERYERLLEAKRQGRMGKPGEGTRLDDHRFVLSRTKDPGAVEQTRQLLEGALEKAAEADPEGAHSFLVAGKHPGRIVEELSGARSEAECFVDWKSALRMFVARARAPIHTWARPNRRFPARVGEIPGRTWSPRAIERPKLLVAIDTSMSMSSKELEEIGKQLAILGDQAEIVVAECDVEITRVYRFAGALWEVEGRGGTDLRPVFEPAFLETIHPDGIVYFTDGMGPAPKTPPKVPALWVLTKPFAFECQWGERAYLGRGKQFRVPPP